ncbi:MAG: hypothetical protein ACKOXF_09100 [Chitinophagaceae bacterium]
MNFLRILILISLLSACHSKISDTSTSDDKNETVVSEKPLSDLVFLMNFKGKYPYDCQLLDNNVTGPRLRKLLGERYDFVKSIWNVETPIEIQDSLLYAWAMQEQSGGDPAAVVMADIPGDQLFVGIRENGQVKLYSETGNSYPERLKIWARDSVNR